MYFPPAVPLFCHGGLYMLTETVLVKPGKINP